MGRKEVVKVSADEGAGVVPRIKWFMVIYMAISHLAALYGLYLLLSEPKLSTFLVVCVTFWCSGLGVTGGAHRLWSHRSYKAKDPLRFFLMLCNSMANQGSIFHWSRDHRVHHRYSETSADPHNASRGFFFAHMGWLFVDKNRRVVEAGEKVGMQDLTNDWIVMFQNNNKHWLMPLMCFVVPASICTLFGDSYFRGLWIAGFMRYVGVLHATWCVNSLAHWFGNRPYADINPAENLLVAAMTGGEGWHNYHHVYPADYSAGEFGWSGQFNPTTLFIDFMALIGQAYDRKKQKMTSKREPDDNDHVDEYKLKAQ